MAYDRIEPVGSDPFDRVAKVQRLQRRTRDEEAHEQEERRQERREEEIERARRGLAKRDEPDDDQPHIDVRA